jgi:hypothetical protein
MTGLTDLDTGYGQQQQEACFKMKKLLNVKWNLCLSPFTGRSDVQRFRLLKFIKISHHLYCRRQRMGKRRRLP